MVARCSRDEDGVFAPTACPSLVPLTEGVCKSAPAPGVRAAMLRRLILLALCTTACSARSSYPTASIEAPAARAEPLDQSLFARTPQGTLSEAALQEILTRPVDLELPARVGVLPIVQAEDWRGPGPSHDMVSPGLSAFAKRLAADDSFALVTEMMPIPSGALGMEALREAAARYKLRYLVLYREHVDRDQRGNGWAAGYLTVVGALFLPGSTLSVDGYAEASLLDVKTGLLLFTVRQRLSDDRRSTVWHRDHKLDRMQRKLALEVAGSLADDARTAINQLDGLWAETPVRSAPTEHAAIEAPPSLAASEEG